MNKYAVAILTVAVLIIQVISCDLASAAFTSSSASSMTAVSISLINQDPDPAIAGDTMDLRLGVENLGGKAAENLVVEIVPDYPFTLMAGQSAAQLLGTIQGYQYSDNMQIVKYTLRVDKDATAGTYELKVKYYEQGSSDITQKSFSVVATSRESAEIIHIDKTVLIPGEESSLKFTINNVGNAPLRDLTFYWENSDDIILPVGSDNTKYIKYLDVDGSVDLEYQVIADTNANAGLYKLDLHLTYDDPLRNSTKTISTIAGVYVGGETDFDIAFSETSGSQMTFTIANVGSNPASSVSVIIPDQSGWRVSGTNSVIIGNLNTGDYTVASFTLSSQQSMPSNRTGGTPDQSASAQSPLKIDIAYTDTMGRRSTVEKNVTLGMSSMLGSNSTSASFGSSQFGRQQQSFFSKYSTYIIILMLLVVTTGLVIGYAKYRKERLVNPAFKARDLFKKKEAQHARKR